MNIGKDAAIGFIAREKEAKLAYASDGKGNSKFFITGMKAKNFRKRYTGTDVMQELGLPRLYFGKVLDGN